MNFLFSSEFITCEIKQYKVIYKSIKCYCIIKISNEIYNRSSKLTIFFIQHEFEIMYLMLASFVYNS